MGAARLASARAAGRPPPLCRRTRLLASLLAACCCLALACARAHCLAGAPRGLAPQSARRLHSLVARQAVLGKKKIAEYTALLDIAPGTSSFAELKKAYRVKAKQCHPDIAVARGADPEKAAALFVRIQMAFEALKPVIEEQGDEGLEFDPNMWNGQFAWELSAGEVRAVVRKEESLRDLVWFSLRWGAQLWDWELDGALRDKRGLPPPAAGLMRAVVVLLPLLDEVTRRELRIDSAMQSGDEAEAKKLLAGKSPRHLAYEAYLGVLRIEGEGSQKAADCFEIYKSLGAGTDITAEDEDAFDPNKDVDVAKMLVSPQRALEAGALQLQD